jgi:hypothetical protein
MSVASEFCELYENATQLGSERFMRGLVRTLPRLQAAGVSLPYPDEFDELPESDLDLRLSTEERQAVDSPVAELLRELDWGEVKDEVGDPMDWFFLYDDLSDIYADVKEGFRLLDAGQPEAEAVWVWRDNFWAHWGYHNAGALKIVHYYVALNLGG